MIVSLPWVNGVFGCRAARLQRLCDSRLIPASQMGPFLGLAAAWERKEGG